MVEGRVVRRPALGRERERALLDQVIDVEQVRRDVEAHEDRQAREGTREEHDPVQGRGPERPVALPLPHRVGQPPQGEGRQRGGDRPRTRQHDGLARQQGERRREREAARVQARVARGLGRHAARGARYRRGPAHVGLDRCAVRESQPRLEGRRAAGVGDVHYDPVGARSQLAERHARRALPRGRVGTARRQGPLVELHPPGRQGPQLERRGARARHAEATREAVLRHPVRIQPDGVGVRGEGQRDPGRTQAAAQVRDRGIEPQRVGEQPRAHQPQGGGAADLHAGQPLRGAQAPVSRRRARHQSASTKALPRSASGSPFQRAGPRLGQSLPSSAWPAWRTWASCIGTAQAHPAA